MFAAPRARVGLDPRLFAPWLFISALVGAFGVALKLQRALQIRGLSATERALVLLPDIAFALAFLCLLYALSALLSRLAWPRTALVCAQVLALVVVLVHMLSHGYYLASGQTLDYPMFQFSLLRADETYEIVAGEAHGPLAAALLVLPAALLALPVWLFRRAAQRVQASSAPATWTPTVVALSVSALCLVAVPAPKVSGVPLPFVRDPMSYLVAGAYAMAFPKPRYRGKLTRLRKLGAESLVRASGDDADQKPKNLALIVLESTRADVTGAYRDELRTTPFLRGFAAESVKVERAYAVVPHTSKALVSIFCGYEPDVTLGVIESKGQGALPGKCLPALLAEQGYETAFFQAPTGRFESRGVLVKNLGFRTFRSGDNSPRIGLERINYFGYEDAVMLHPSAQFLAKARKGPFFAAYLTSASHHPYAVPRRHPQKAYDRKNHAKNAYLNAVAYVDHVVSRIVQQYKDAGLYDDTVFLVLGDHGEAFGEHGLYTHDDVMFEEGLRIPLLLRLPHAERRGATIAGPVNELSVVPTLLDVLGFAAHGGGYEAASWFERPSEPVLYANCYRADHCAAVIRGDRKLIYYFDEREPSYFDLRRDPKERRDLAERHEREIEAWTRDLLDVRFAVHESYRTANERALASYVTKTAPKVENRLSARFGKYLEVLGYDAPASERLRNFGFGSYRRFLLGVGLRVLETPPEGYALRDRLTGESDTVLAEHVPVRGLHPLRDFKPGTYVMDEHWLNVPRGWSSPSLHVCLELADEHGVPVEVSGPGLDGETCVPILTVPVAQSKPRKR